jgi:hypothetical protein
MPNTGNKTAGNFKKELCFDFDGVIHSYTNGWNGVDLALDPPVKEIKETIDILKENYKITIYSSRCSHEAGIKCISDYCKEHNIHYDKISNIKPPAFLTIDDRCICFDGESFALIEKIKNFVPWTKKDKKIKPAYYFNFDDLNTSSDEGKLLLAALSILTTTSFTYKNKLIDGEKKHPDEIIDILKDLTNDIFYKSGKE